jgi:hypothetical protein
MEITGKLFKVMPMQSGTGKNGEWRKQDFVLEVPGTYPKKVAMTVWSERTQELQALALGQEIKAFFDVESREYNERWYTDLKVWKIEKVMTSPVSGNSQQNPSSNTSAPWDNTPAHTIPVPQENPFASENDSNSDDDLPF